MAISIPVIPRDAHIFALDAQSNTATDRSNQQVKRLAEIIR